MRSSAPASHPQSGVLAYNLATITVLVLLLAVGAAYIIDIMGKNASTTPPDRADKPTVSVTLAGTELVIPASWFRSEPQAQGSFVNQIDLHVRLGTNLIPVDVTLVPRSRVRPGNALLDRVYLHEFGDETLSGVPGLVGKPLHDSDDQISETVWYDALSANPFVAMCMAPVTQSAPSRCLRTVFLPSGIAAVYAFDATALPSWRQFDVEMQKWLGQIGAM